MEHVTINKKQYIFYRDYKENEGLRKSLHSLTQSVFDFNFEDWYQSSYWPSHCKLYSLFDKDKIVSHLTVSIMDCVILGKKSTGVQIGTVMTDKAYRNQGLSRLLIEKVLQEWESKSDFIYLFANDQVCHFYPKFGFAPVNEYQATRQIKHKRNELQVRKMQPEEMRDHRLLYQVANKAVALGDISIQNNAGLIMFYTLYFESFTVKENLYYLPDLNTIAIAEYHDNELFIYDILATSQINVDDVIGALAQQETDLAVFGFMPRNVEQYDVELFKEDNSTLFIKGKTAKLFRDHKLRFPILSQT